MSAFHPTANEQRNSEIRRLAMDLRHRLDHLGVMEDETFRELDLLTAELPENPKVAERLNGLPRVAECEGCTDLEGAQIDRRLNDRDGAAIEWIIRCPTCKRFASDDAAALHMAKSMGYVIGWMHRDDTRAIQSPYVALTPAQARIGRGEFVWQWGADELTCSLPGDVAAHIAQFLTENVLRDRGLHTVTDPYGKDLSVEITGIAIGGEEHITASPDVTKMRDDEWTTALPGRRCGSMYVGPRLTGDDGNQPTVGSIVNIDGQAALIMAALGSPTDPTSFVGHAVPLDFRAAVEMTLTRDLMTPADRRAIVHVLDLED